MIELIGLLGFVAELCAVCVLSVLAASLYGYPGMSTSPPPPKRLYEEERPELVVNLRYCPLDELRRLDKAYSGTQRGEDIHIIREQRIVDERSKVHTRINERQAIISRFEGLVKDGALNGLEERKLKSLENVLRER